MGEFAAETLRRCANSTQPAATTVGTAKNCIEKGAIVRQSADAAHAAKLPALSPP
ncbi:hypothetical protein ACFCP7_09025 [Paenibacillus elgii]